MKKLITSVLLLTLLLSLSAASFAADKAPKPSTYAEASQRGHPALLTFLYGEKTAKEVIESYGKPSYTYGLGLLPSDDKDRDGSVSKPFIWGATTADKYAAGVYFTMLSSLFKVEAVTTYNNTKIITFYACEANGTVKTGAILQSLPL